MVNRGKWCSLECTNDKIWKCKQKSLYMKKKQQTHVPPILLHNRNAHTHTTLQLVFFFLFFFVRASQFVSVLCLPLCAFDFANDEVVRIFRFVCACVCVWRGISSCFPFRSSLGESLFGPKWGNHCFYRIEWLSTSRCTILNGMLFLKKTFSADNVLSLMQKLEKKKKMMKTHRHKVRMRNAAQ